jgi:hypothetical protein
LRQPRQRGQAIVEFGVVILLLLLIVGAATDLGLYMAARETMAAATGEAARQVAYGTEPKDVMDITRQSVSGSLVNGGAIAVSITYCKGPTGPTPGLPCTARGKSYCTSVLTPEPPTSAILASSYQGCYSDWKQPLPTSDLDPDKPHAGDWAVIVLTDQWELFTVITTNLMRGFGGNCASNWACVTTIQNPQLVVYPGPPPTA